MQYNNPNNLPPAIIRPFNKVSHEDCANNDYGKLPQQEAPDMGGYPFVSTGTAATASGTSIYYQVSFVPREGPIPTVELDRVHFAHLMEIRPEIRGTNQAK